MYERLCPIFYPVQNSLEADVGVDGSLRRCRGQTRVRRSDQEIGVLGESTNRDISALLIQAADTISSFLGETSYERQRTLGFSGLEVLNRVAKFQHDLRTELWAAYFDAIAHKWHAWLDHEIELARQDISPILNLRLAEDDFSLSDKELDGGKTRAIVRLENSGRGRPEE